MDGVNDLYKGAVLYDETENYSNKSIVFNIDENGEAAIYQSLINDNSGNALTDETKWKKVDLGGIYYEEYGEAEITLPTTGITGISYEII